MLHVTHDQEEAMTLGNRVAVLDAGALQQVAPPLEVYRRPANVFVAGFIGSPAMNLFRCRAECHGGATWIVGPHFRIAASLPPGDGREVIAGIRPHDVAVSGRPGSHATGRVDVVQPVGSEILVQLELAGGSRPARITAAVPPDARLRIDDEVGLRIESDRLHLFDAATGVRIEPAGGPGAG
jgi:ABC-type sugar transport system ATPase subunit